MISCKVLIRSDAVCVDYFIGDRWKNRSYPTLKLDLTVYAAVDSSSQLSKFYRQEVRN